MDVSPLVVSGNLGALNATVDGLTDVSSYSTVRLQIAGVWVGTIQFQSSVDGVNWSSKYLTFVNGTGSTGTTSTTGVLYGDIAGRYFRVQMTAYTSGSAIVTALYTEVTTAFNGISIAGLRSTASSDAVATANIDEVSIGAFNGSTIDRIYNISGSAPSKSLMVATGVQPTTSINAAAAPVAGSALDGVSVRPNHTLQVDVVTTTAGTGGAHTVAIQGSLDGVNWVQFAALTLASTSTSATDASNHAGASYGPQAWRYIRANWTAIPTLWVGTLTARVASA